jgi:DNA-binding response OmpR family regulator
MKRVHLVEDDEGIAELVAGSLAGEGLAVERFRDAESALQALARSEPDAILLTSACRARTASSCVASSAARDAPRS